MDPMVGVEVDVLGLAQCPALGGAQLDVAESEGESTEVEG